MYKSGNLNLKTFAVKVLYLAMARHVSYAGYFGGWCCFLLISVHFLPLTLSNLECIHYFCHLFSLIKLAI